VIQSSRDVLQLRVRRVSYRFHLRFTFRSRRWRKGDVSDALSLLSSLRIKMEDQPGLRITTWNGKSSLRALRAVLIDSSEWDSVSLHPRAINQLQLLKIGS
jgi:hypothetical protein